LKSQSFFGDYFMATVAQLEKKLKQENQKLEKEWSSIVYYSNSTANGRLLNENTRRALVKWWKNENLKCFMAPQERTELWNQIVPVSQLMSRDGEKELKKDIQKLGDMSKLNNKVANRKKKIDAMAKKEKNPKTKKQLTKIGVALSYLLAFFAKFKSAIKNFLTWIATSPALEGVRKVGKKAFVLYDIVSYVWIFFKAKTKGLSNFQSIVYTFIDKIDSILFYGGMAVGVAAAAAGSGPAAAIAGAASIASWVIFGIKMIYGFFKSNKKRDLIENAILTTSADIDSIFGSNFLKKKKFETTCNVVTRWEASGGDNAKNQIIDKIYRSRMARKRLEFVLDKVEKVNSQVNQKIDKALKAGNYDEAIDLM